VSLQREAGVPGNPTRAPQEAGVRKRLSAARRRALIMEAAARLFAERGYPGTSMIDIAAAAGIAPSVIYDHFPSKKDLHLELLSQHARALIEATTLIEAATPGTEGAGEALMRRSTEAFFSFVEQHPYAWRMLFRDPPADDEIAAVHARIHRHGTAAITGLIHRAPALRLPAGIARDRGDEMLARAIKSSSDGLAAWWYEHPEVAREQVVEVAIALCWRGLAVLTRALPGSDR
jgi:AcrR family transcriptional regulator